MPLKQLNTTSLDSLFQAAVNNTHWLEAITQQFALFSQGEAHGIGVKGALEDGVDKNGDAVTAGPSARAHQKAAEKGDHNLIKDMIRTSVSYPNCTAVAGALKMAPSFFEVVEAKDHFTNPKAGGYVDINLIVVNPKTKHLCEVQIHFDTMLESKHAGGHAAYKKERSAANGRAIRDINDPISRALAMRATWQGQDAYQEARRQLYADPGKSAMIAALRSLEALAKANAKKFMALPHHQLKHTGKGGALPGM